MILRNPQGTLFYTIISKCGWLVLVLTSGVSLLQRVFSCSRVLLSLHSPQKWKKQTEWVLLSFSSAVWFNEGKRNTALCGTHIKTPALVEFKERGRKMREEVRLNIPGKPFGFYIRMNSERTRCELLILGKN